MASGPTYEPISNITLTTSQTTITFGAGGTLPQTYTDLVLIASAKQDGTATTTNGYLEFNGNQTGYSRTSMYGNGSTPASERGTNMDELYFAFDPNATNFAQYTMNFMNYSNASTFKTAIIRYGSADIMTGVMVGTWRNTAAITTISMTASDNKGGGTADKFVAGSTFTLYGIKAA